MSTDGAAAVVRTATTTGRLMVVLDAHFLELRNFLDEVAKLLHGLPSVRRALIVERLNFTGLLLQVRRTARDVHVAEEGVELVARVERAVALLPLRTISTASRGGRLVVVVLLLSQYRFGHLHLARLYAHNLVE